MNHEKAVQHGTAAAEPSDKPYENVDPLPQSTVKTTHMYENIPTVPSSPHHHHDHQNNIELNQCPAYGALM